MCPQFLDDSGRQRTFVAGPQIRRYVVWFAHARNGGADAPIREDETQCQFR